MVASIGDARLRYQRNPVRLGAMRNMFQAITAGRGKYTLAFHEDDLLGARYLATAVGILETRCVVRVRRRRAARVRRSAAAGRAGRASHAQLDRSSGSPTPGEFLRMIFRGVEPMFGSVVYRRAAVEGLAGAHEQFATLVDRPFLMSILARWSGALIRDPLVWYGKHGEGDVRHLAMNTRAHPAAVRDLPRRAAAHG